MNKLLTNMLPYEIILLIMGIIIFLALIFLLTWSVMKKRSITGFLPFFLLPVIMVGYPSIKSIKIGDAIIEIQTLTEKVNQNSSDSTASANLEKAVAQLKSGDRLSKSKEGLIAVAGAQIAMGKYDSASLYLHKAGKLAPKSSEVKSLKNKLTTKIIIQEEFSKNISNLNNQILQLKHTPGDTASLNNIVHTLSSLTLPTYIHPNEVLTLAKSYAITGQKQQALVAVNKLNKTTLDSDTSLRKLKDSINIGIYQKQFFKYNEQPKIKRLPDLDKNILNKTTIKKINIPTKP